MKTINDFEEFTAAEQRHAELRDELRQLQAERQKIDEQRRAALTATSDQRATALVEGSFVNFESFAGQLHEIDSSITLHERAVSIAAENVEKVRSAISPEICAQHRPEFVKEIRKILAALKQVDDANQRLAALRQEIESQGVRTGSLHLCAYDSNSLGSWRRRHIGGRLPAYLDDIARNWPELEPMLRERE